MDKEEIAHLETMISLHRKNLYTLEEMLAKYGSDQPLHLINSVTMEKEAIARYTRQIESAHLQRQGTRKIKLTGKPAKATLFCGQGGRSSRPFCGPCNRTAGPLSLASKESVGWGNPPLP